MATAMELYIPLKVVDGLSFVDAGGREAQDLDIWSPISTSSADIVQSFIAVSFFNKGLVITSSKPREL